MSKNVYVYNCMIFVSVSLFCVPMSWVWMFTFVLKTSRSTGSTTFKTSPVPAWITDVARFAFAIQMVTFWIRTLKPFNKPMLSS